MMVEGEVGGRLTLVSDRGASVAGFERSLELLRGEADEEDWGWLLAGQSLSFRHFGSKTGTLRTEFSAGAEATSAIVQINEPTVPGSENGLSAIGVDGTGARWLVRQGVLHENRVSLRIEGKQFRRLTRLRRSDVSAASGVAKRDWFRITRIATLMR